MQLIAFQHLRTIADKIRQSGFFALEADEVTDSANKEQVIICLRWVDSQLEPHEEFIGLYYVDDITTATIVHVLKDTVLRLNLSMLMCRAQCYDGASNMKKAAKEIKVLEPCTLYLHCFGHSLNLAVSDTLKEEKVMQNSLDISLEICKLLKFSPRRDALFQKLKQSFHHKRQGFTIYVPRDGQCVLSLLKAFDSTMRHCMLRGKKQ